MLFRVLYSLIYSLLLLSISGVTTTAQAVVSCQDTIAPGTTYRYQDALGFFTVFNGKTYALAKSAVSGSKALPDSYFDFSADISLEYQTTGADVASLKRMLSLGKYGAARPVSIDSQVTLDFVLKRYGPYLGSADSAKSTYINAWKEFGPSGFTTLEGNGLPFTNWPATGPYTGQNPQAVVMGSGGVWQSGLDGARSSQIVEFPGVLDCALPYSDPGSVTTPPPPPPTDPNASGAFMCGQDLNNNGYAGDPGEVVNCVETPQGQFCPITTAACLETYSAPVCPSGSSLEPTRDICQATAQNVCGSGYSWDATLDKCTKSVVCPDSGTFNPVTDRCEKLVQNVCPAGYSYDSNPASPTYDRCVKSAACSSGGSFVAGRDRCEKAWTPVCDTANGYVYNSLTGTCQHSPICSYGSYNASYNLCVQAISPTCPSGYSYNASRARCEKTPECPTGTPYNPLTNQCESISSASLQPQALSCTPQSFLCVPSAADCCNVNITCPNGPQGQVNVAANYCCLGSDAVTIQSPLNFLTRTELTSTGYALSALQCDSSGNCSYYFRDHYCDGSPASEWELSRTFSMASTQMVCPAGQTLVNGNQCLSSINPTCSGGTFDSNLDVCWAAYAPTCIQGTYDSSSGLCILAPSCPNGTLNTSNDLCEATITKNCGTYSLDASRNLCYSAPVCSSGSYNATLNVCQATLTRNCGTYSWSQAEFKCLQSITCPKDLAFSLSSTVSYSTTLDKCISNTQHNCPTGTTYTPLPVGKCEAIPICNGSGIYDPQKNSCFEGFNTCPFGTQYACMNYQGTMQCSPNSCFNPAAPGAEETTTLDESMLQDDGERDANGQCLGKIYIFNGKPSRCRPPGLTVGMLNNCCESDEVAAEDTGGNVQDAAQGIQIAYEVGQVAYYGNALATGAAEISAISTSATGAVTSMTVVTATGTTTTLSGAAATGAYATMASGTTGISAIGAGLEAYAAALFNPTTIVIAIVVMVVMKVLMGSGCDAGDIQTGMQNAAKDCHYVGDYCQKKWPMVGCVQKAKSFCCFNSKMARIIHEQGRPQLQTFQPNGAWGTAKQPNCRGYTPDEFQALDFSRIDLSEYFADVQKDLATKIDGSQQTIMQNIQNKYQAAPK
ncbi:MAG: hypothetical protein CVU66_00520 [Deltaproteobacteria bacterium HGW-Deltaproteobacteria-23]|nr:MAG: hypothetical protein CVU66_00520 [Deltaproteobacteria bacterium HGW-Deltaproteobacteria-23]